MSYFARYTSQRTSRRRLLATGASLSLGAAALTVGCGSDDNSQPEESASAQPKPGGILKLGLSYDLLHMEPHVSITAHKGTSWQIWERMTEYSHDLKVLPRIVEKWEVNADATQTVLHIRPGIKWHTGREITSEDLKWNIIRPRDPAVPAGSYKQMSNWFDVIETPTPQTLLLKPAKPRPAQFDFFELISIADRVTFEQKGLTTMVGAGPFMLQEWKQGISLKLVKFPDYWDKSLPHLDGLTFTVNLNDQNAVAQLEAGAIDYYPDTSLTAFMQVKDKSGFQGILAPPTGEYYVMVTNVTKAPFDDKRVRQAMNWALDRDRYTKLVLKGLSQPKSLPWSPSSPAYEESKDKHYNTLDLKKAADLLKAAGITNLNTSIIPQTVRPELVEQAALLQNDLATIGVKLNVRILEPAVWSPAINALEYEGMGTFSAGQAGFGSPSTMFTSIPNVWGGVRPNNSGFTNARWTELVEQASIEPDARKAKAIYSELNDIIIDDAHIVALGSNPVRHVSSNKLKNVGYALYGAFIHREAWLET